MRRMVWLGVATLLMGGAAVAVWTQRVHIEVEVIVRDPIAPVVDLTEPSIVATAPTRLEADEPIVVERPTAPAFTSLPEFDAAPGVVQSHGEAQPPPPGETNVPRMPEVLD